MVNTKEGHGQSAGGGNGPPNARQEGGNSGVPFLLLEVRDYANGLNKSLDESEIESCPHTAALFLESGRWDQVLRTEGRVRHREEPPSIAEETRRGWSPFGMYPASCPPQNQSRLLLDSLHRFV